MNGTPTPMLGPAPMLEPTIAPATSATIAQVTQLPATGHKCPGTVDMALLAIILASLCISMICTAFTIGITRRR